MILTDNEAARKAIAALESLSEEQQSATSTIDSLLSSENPSINIHELFSLYNTLYFLSLLQDVEVSWSARLIVRAGICELMRDPRNDNQLTRIRLKLSEPLLKYRNRSDVVNTLLHEAIHAYFFATTSSRHARENDGTGHGPGFLLLTDAINKHGGYQISASHGFHDEVDIYRTHVWQCNGPCRQQEPQYGLVKRATNRAPGESDIWWKKHDTECGGTFMKIAEPERNKAKLERSSRLERAGRQTNTLDWWVKSGKQQETKAGDTVVDGEAGTKRDQSTSNKLKSVKRARKSVSCPICSDDVATDEINEHLDRVHPP
jgi:hypothetical protein